MKNIPLLKHIMTICFFAIISFSVQAQTYTFATVPPLNGGNAQRGITFNLEALTNITVTQLAVRANVGSMTGVQIWYRPGGVQHNPGNPPVVTVANGWILAGNVASFSVTSSTALTPIPLTLNVSVPAGQKYGFMINNTNSSNPTFIYTTGSGLLSYTDTRITLHVGTNSGYGGPAPNPTFHPRNFNGSVTYNLTQAGGGPALPPIAGMYPGSLTPTHPVTDTVWIGSPVTLINTSSGASRVYWDLPEEVDLNQGYTRQNVGWTNQQYIDTTKYNNNFTYTFNRQGFWKVRLLAINSGKPDSLRDSVIRYIYVDTPSRVPTASFISFKQKVGFGDYSRFVDLSINGPTSWSWSYAPYCNKCNSPPFFPNFFAGAADQNPLFFGGDPGTYSVCLQVWNARGWDSICQTDYITVTNSYNVCSGSGSTQTSDNEGYLFAPSGPNFSYTRSQLSGCPGIILSPCADSVYFFVERIKMLPSDSLEFYNGTSAIAANKIKTIGASTTGQLALPDSLKTFGGGRQIYMRFKTGTASIPPNYDSAGFSIRWSSKPATYGKPSASFDFQDTVYSNQPLEYVNKSTGTLMQFSWDTDGNGIYDSTGTNPKRTFVITTPTVKQICLVSYNCVGSDTLCKNVVFLPVISAPEARFEVDKFNGFNTDSFFFSDKSVNGPSTWRWTTIPASVQYLKGTNSNSQNPIMRFTQRTKYTIKLVVSNIYGADSLIKSEIINVGAFQNANPNAVTDPSTGIGITRVQLATLDTSTNAINPPYQFVTGNQTANLYRGVDYLLSVTRPDTNIAMSRRAWIDFNKDGEFGNNELVLTEDSGFTFTYSSAIRISDNQTEGTTRLRVGVTLSGTVINSVYATYGVFRDYVVEFPSDEIKPTIQLLGGDTLSVEVNKSFIDPGVLAFDNLEGDISNKYITIGVVDTSALGPNYIKYFVKDLYGNYSDTLQRIVFVELNQTGPQLELVGSDTFYTDVNVKYFEPGYVAIDNRGIDITQYVVVSGNVDTTTLGVYTLNYKITGAFGFFDEINRVVIVQDTTRPVIRASLGSPYVHQVNIAFDPLDAVVIDDNFDKNINATYIGIVDVNNVGTYYLTYYAKDGQNNEAIPFVVAIEVNDTVSPEIQLNGDDPLNIEVFSTFNDPFVTFNDNYWPQNTIVITVAGVINISELGSYFRTYTATDPSGNKSSITRIINVIDLTKPVVKILGDNPINLERWQVFEDPGVALDDNYNVDAEMRPFLNSVNNLPLNAEGKPFGDEEGLFSVRYRVKDLSGNESDEAVRLIRVNAANAVRDYAELHKYIYFYPIPAKDIFNIQIIKTQPVSPKVEIFDLTGKRVLNFDLRNQSLIRQQFDVSKLSSGLYSIKVKISEGTYFVKLVVE